MAICTSYRVGQSQNASAASLSVSHQYNATGHRLTAILVNGQTVLSQIGYEPDGAVNGWRWGNNQTVERFYNQAGRLTVVSLGFDSLGFTPDSRYLGYDAAGRVTDIIADSDAQLNQRYEYDPLDRLIGSQRGETPQNRTGYRYDLSGNRTGKVRDVGTAAAVEINYSLDAASNRLQSQSEKATVVNYSYDAVGHLVSDGTFNFSYNDAGQRIAAGATGLNASYRYNAIGQRISKTVNGITRQYLYDERGHLTGEYDAASALIQEIVWLGDLPVAVLRPAATPGSVEVDYIHADHLGTPRKITRPSDNKTVWAWESEAFGNSLPDQNPAGLGAFEFNLRFPGQYYDAETGLHYNMARYYNPRLGRYESSDPIGLAGGVNTYAYVAGDPVNWIDPSGLVVEINGTTRQATTDLNKAYQKVRSTQKGKQLCEALESSPDTYNITNKSPDGAPDRASYAYGRKIITVDPNYHPKLNTSAGRQRASTAVILGHEIGHAATGIDDWPSPDRMNNVNANENPIRDELGIPRRTTYP
ncbi:MAG: RHS repeat-associated core domain-containing protein [Methylobacter sp.]